MPPMQLTKLLSRSQRLRLREDEIARAVRFDGWQARHAGEREIKKALRQTLFKLHQDTELFERAHGYIREYYS